ncbi:hypothetical protein KAR10_06570 [bacterium]|nr:hypothetical protein [bacterium]
MINEKANTQKLLAELVKRIKYQNQRFSEGDSGFSCLRDIKKLAGLLEFSKHSRPATIALDSISAPAGSSETYELIDVENLPVSKLLL